MSPRFLELLRAVGKKRVALFYLRHAWLDAHPEQGQHPERDTELLRAMRTLEAQFELQLPAEASFETFGNPPMPKFVTVTNGHAPSQAMDWSQVPWVPELGFWTELPRTLDLIAAKQINDWLLEHRGKFVTVPLRERSLEIFGDEKQLDLRVSNDSLFSGRLRLSDIGAFTVPLPLPYRAVDAPDKPLLVVENHHSYWSFGEWNESERRYAAVVYGAGKAFSSSGRALGQVIDRCGATHAEYLGDLDPTGVLIPVRFNEVQDVKVKPAEDLYAWLLKNGRRRPQVNHLIDETSLAARWLPALAQEVTEMWEAESWIPQEALGYDQLRHLTETG